jgi:hypothetical protein
LETDCVELVEPLLVVVVPDVDVLAEVLVPVVFVAGVDAGDVAVGLAALAGDEFSELLFIACFLWVAFFDSDLLVFEWLLATTRQVPKPINNQAATLNMTNTRAKPVCLFLAISPSIPLMGNYTTL